MITLVFGGVNSALFGYFLKGLSVRQIAKRAGISHMSVYRQLKKAGVNFENPRKRKKIKAYRKKSVFNLDSKDFPKSFYNIVPDLPKELPPPLNPETKQPIDPKSLHAIFPKELVSQEISSERFIDIPRQLRELYIKIGRPRPLYRATRLEDYLNLPSDVKIFYKREDLSPVGSHKVNTALAQAYYAKKEGFERLSTETGAGQWGSAVSLASAFLDMKPLVFMVRASYEQKPSRRILMKLMGAEVFDSPSGFTEIGKKLAQDPKNKTGSLGIAISEAIEIAAKDEKTAYTLGSVLNSVLLHQTIIGQETKKQLEIAGEKPDILVGCVGGGSNFGGLSFPFIQDILKGKEEYEILAAEPVASPSLTKGKYAYDHGDTGGLTPLLKMYTLGSDYIPPPIYAGGLRYHGASPILSLLKKENFVKSVEYEQKETFEAGRIFAKTEGIVPAPETNHAIKAGIDEAVKTKRKGKSKTILIGFSGHGHYDLLGYEDVLGL